MVFKEEFKIVEECHRVGIVCEKYVGCHMKYD